MTTKFNCWKLSTWFIPIASKAFKENSKSSLRTETLFFCLFFKCFFPHKISWMPTVDVIICGTEDNAGREQGHTGELYAECDWETAMEKKAWSKPYDDCFSPAGSLYPPKYLVSTWFSADSPDLAILGQGHHKTWSSTSCQKDTLQQLLSFSVNYSGTPAGRRFYFLLNYFLYRTRLSLKLMEDMSPVDLQNKKRKSLVCWSNKF